MMEQLLQNKYFYKRLPLAMNDLNTDSKDGFNLELFFELSPDLLCIAGYDGYFKKINSTVSKTLGYTNEELFARPIQEFVHIEDRTTTLNRRENLKRNIPLLNFENRYVTKSGETIWLSWTSIPIESEKVVFAVAKNVTHRRRQDDDRNLLLANLTRINNNLKQLNYTTSHDLRSPVSNLLSVFSLMNTLKIEDKEVLEFIDILKAATENLKNTLNNYVDVLSNDDALSVPLEELDLAECLVSVQQSLRSLIQDSRATFRVDFSEVPKAIFNRTYMESVFLNLVTNSIKYARSDAPPVISISSRRENGVDQLIFADNGQGFDMDKVKNRIFGFNQKFHNHSDSKGIGLYLVYNHVTNLGGHIAFKSAVNKGTKFTISFRDIY
jgi:PAS domain S-box-containing protein